MRADAGRRDGNAAASGKAGVTRPEGKEQGQGVCGSVKQAARQGNRHYRVERESATLSGGL